MKRNHETDRSQFYETRLNAIMNAMSETEGLTRNWLIYSRIH